jgi:hypothetical protein
MLDDDGTLMIKYFDLLELPSKAEDQFGGRSA